MSAGSSVQEGVHSSDGKEELSSLHSVDSESGGESLVDIGVGHLGNDIEDEHKAASSAIASVVSSVSTVAIVLVADLASGAFENASNSHLIGHSNSSLSHHRDESSVEGSELEISNGH